MVNEPWCLKCRLRAGEYGTKVTVQTRESFQDYERASREPWNGSSVLDRGRIPGSRWGHEFWKRTMAPLRRISSI